jgi:hypothetical protein
MVTAATAAALTRVIAFIADAPSGWGLTYTVQSPERTMRYSPWWPPPASVIVGVGKVKAGSEEVLGAGKPKCPPLVLVAGVLRYGLQSNLNR